MRWAARRLIPVLGAVALVYAIYSTLLTESTWSTDLFRWQPRHNKQSKLLRERRREVSDAFQHAWDGYARHCMGHDTMHPVSNTCDDDFGGWGATAIDALSTAIMFDKPEVVQQILRFIATVDFSVVVGGTSIQLFEVTIRHFGAMLSAHDLLNGPYSDMITDEGLRQTLYTQTIRLGDALSCAFDTPSGVPRNWVNPTLCTTDSGTSNTVAGAGSLILEFARLSDITGQQKYVQLARKAEQYLINPSPMEHVPFPGILGSFISVDSGRLIGAKGSWGSLADSFYEYLIKAYMYNPDVYGLYLDRWKLAVDSTIQHIASHPYGRPKWTLLPYWQGQERYNAMDSLSWFAGGNFILGGMVTHNQTLIDFGLSIADTGGAVYSMTATGLGGEYVEWTENCSPGWTEGLCNADNSVRVSDVSFKLRPEVLETWYYAFRATRDPKYREWTWAAFQAINRVCRTDTGFSAISDVTHPDGGRKLDQQESFVFAEVLKYVHLIHVEDETVDIHVQDSRAGRRNTWVFNTEAHPFQVAGRPV